MILRDKSPRRNGVRAEQTALISDPQLLTDCYRSEFKIVLGKISRNTVLFFEKYRIHPIYTRNANWVPLTKSHHWPEVDKE